MRQVLAKVGLYRTVAIVLSLVGLLAIFGPYVTAASRAALTRLLTVPSTAQAGSSGQPALTAAAQPAQAGKVAVRLAPRTLPTLALNAPALPSQNFSAYLTRPALGAGAFFAAPTLSYNNQNRSLDAGGSETINPTNGPLNATSIFILSTGCYTGGIAVNNSTGIVQLFNAARNTPATGQTCTITVRATNANDMPATNTDASFTVQVNYAPTFTSQAVMRTAGNPSTNSMIIDNLSDDYTSLANLVVRINGGTSASVNGVTVSNLTRTNNMYFADIVAGCNASNATFALTVTDERGATATGNLNVTVAPNPPPVAPTYNATPYEVNQGQGLTIDRLTPPSDNSGIVTVTIGGAGGYNGGISINNTPGPDFGDITITNASPGGATPTITVTATDNCGVTKDSTLQLKINAPPSIAASTPGVRQGNAPLNQTLANVTDPEDPVSALTVNVSASPVNGVTLSNVTVNSTTGEVRADVSASCSATNANFTLTATDSKGLSSNSTIMVTVLPNTPPVLSYPSTVNIGANTASTTINPTSGPSDNGSIASLTRTTPMVTACGTITVNSTPGPNFGQVTVANSPATQQTCSVTIQAVDNCGGAGGTTNATFNVSITAPMIGISKTHTPIGATVQPGEVALFQLNFSNTGNQDATGATLTETVPANSTFEALASSPGWSCADGAPAGTSCTYNIGNVGIGGSGTIFFGVRAVNPVAIGVTAISNQFSYSDSVTGTQNSNVDMIPIVAFPDLAVAKTDNGIISGAGQTITYFVSYTNVGRRNAAGVVITETVPANTTFNAAASLPAVWSCANGSPAGTTCTINVGNVAGGASGMYKFAVDVNAVLPAGVTQVTNTASITDGSGTDPEPANNSSTETTPVGNGLIVSPVAVGRTQGSPATNSTIALATDALAPVSSVVVTTTAVPAGITITNITNNGTGTINADIAAGCNAALGPNIIGLKATDSANNMTFVNLTVNVAANTAPVLGIYPATGPINPGTSTTVSPSAAPTDNGSLASITAAAPGFTGTFSVNPTTGVVNVSNAGPSGTFTVTVTATDNCGLTATTTFSLVVNTPPTITPAAPLSLSQGSTTAGVAVATVNDINTPAGNLIVTMESAPPGILLTNFVNSGGAVTATVAVGCTAALGANTVVLKVSDGGLTTTANLIVNVTANTAPVLGSYATSSVNSGAGTTITPGAAPTDNGFITGIVASAPGFTGNFSVNTATGVITVTNAGPMGMFTVTVTATDNCGLSSTTTFQLNVNCAPFTVNVPGVATGTVSTPFSQSFTTAGGVAPFTFALTTGTLPAGLTLAPGGVLAGTPTQSGTFPITVTATDSNGCTSTSAVYTLVIACQTITVNPPPVATGTVGVAFSQNFAQAGGVGAVTYTLNTGTIPTGLTLAPNGVLSGVPTQSGTFPLTVKVTDGNGCMGISATYTLVINCQNIAVTPPAVNTGTVSAVFSQSFTQQGGVGALIYTLDTGTLPLGLTLSTSGILAGVPTRSGSFPITVKVTDANGCMGISPTYTLVIDCQTITVTPPAVTTGTANTPFSQSFTQSAGLGAINFTINTGTLPAGLTLAPNGVLSGTPTQTGSFNITVKATDANNCSGISPSYTLVIGCQTLTVNAPAVTTGTIGAAFSETFTQAGGIGAVTFTLNSGALPPGLTLAPNGVLSGTPTQLGSFPVTVKATDANGCMGVSATYTLVIGCQTITVTPPGVTTGTVGTLFSQSFAQTGGLGVVTFALNSGVLPTGITLSTAGLLSGTPTQSGSFPITVKVTDINGCTGVSATYTLVINCQTITVNAPAVATGTVGVPFSQNFTQAGALGGTSYTVNSGALPPGLTLALNGTLAGTPTQAGTYPITVKVTDANGCTGVSPTYTLVIACPAITFAPATLPSGVYGDAYNQTVTASPAGVYEYTVTAGALPTGLSLNLTSGAITGTPSAVGTYNFTITAKYYDNCPASKAYTIVINCPVVTLAPANLVTGTIGLAYSQTVSATPAGTYSFAVTSGALPPGVTLNTATGVISGTPTVIGTYNFTITATGAGGLNGCTGSKDYTIIINCRTVTIAPTTLPGGKVAEPYSQTISATPANTYTFSVANGSLPPGLTLNASTGVISGTPTALGTFNFSIKATDPDTCPGTQAYTVVISCPTITLSPVTLPNGTIGVTYPTTNFAAAPAGTYSFAVTSGSLPAGLTLTTAGVLSGTPTQSGSFQITVTATDANQCTGSRNYTLFINTCPSITVDPLTVSPGVSGSAYSQSFTATGGAAPYTFTLAGTLPTGLSLSSAGVLSGTPTQTGSYNFLVIAQDANQCTGSRAYTLTVTLGCTFGINPGGQSFAQSGGSGTVAVIAASSCGWTAASSDPWLTITSGASGTGNGTVAFTVAANGFVGTRTGTLVIAGQTFTVTQEGLPRAVKADFDGDGLTDLSIWRGATGGWLNINSSNSQLQTINWGAGYAPYFDVPVPGDYDGDGKMDQAIWRGQDSIWYIRRSSDGQPVLLYYGANYAPYFDIPTPGDFDGDGKTDIAVWRRNGTWYVRKSSDGTNMIISHGQEGDVPLAADFDGDGKCDFGVFRPSEVAPAPNWLIRQSSTNTVVSFQWGAGYAPYFDTPVPADYDGDGKADLAIWRGQDSIWYLRPSANPSNPVLKLWGANYAPYFDTPSPGDYDGDGKADIAVWRKTSGTWFVLRSSNQAYLIQQHGQNGDTPLLSTGIR